MMPWQCRTRIAANVALAAINLVGIRFSLVWGRTSTVVLRDQLPPLPIRQNRLAQFSDPDILLGEVDPLEAGWQIRPQCITQGALRVLSKA
jgi:hypothetical protein